MVDWVNCFYRFHFDDYSVLDNEVHPISEFEFLVVVDHRQADLCGDFQTSFSKFVGEACRVDALEKPGAKARMNFHGSINNCARDAVYGKRKRRRARSGSHIDGISQDPCVPQ